MQLPLLLGLKITLPLFHFPDKGRGSESAVHPQDAASQPDAKYYTPAARRWDDLLPLPKGEGKTQCHAVETGSHRPAMENWLYLVGSREGWKDLPTTGNATKPLFIGMCGPGLVFTARTTLVTDNFYVGFCILQSELVFEC